MDHSPLATARFGAPVAAAPLFALDLALAGPLLQRGLLFDDEVVRLDTEGAWEHPHLLLGLLILRPLANWTLQAGASRLLGVGQVLLAVPVAAPLLGVLALHLAPRPQDLRRFGRQRPVALLLVPLRLRTVGFGLPPERTLGAQQPVGVPLGAAPLGVLVRLPLRVLLSVGAPDVREPLPREEQGTWFERPPSATPRHRVLALQPPVNADLAAAARLAAVQLPRLRRVVAS